MHKNVILAGLLWSRIDTVIGGLFLSYVATNEKIEEMLAKTSWFCPEKTSRENKWRMKEAGGSHTKHRIFQATTTILMLAKSIEDCLFIVEAETGTEQKFWTVVGGIEEAETAKQVRQVANVLKHNHGVVGAEFSQAAKYLVEKCGYHENEDLEHRMLSAQGIFDIPATIVGTYRFLLVYCQRTTGVRHTFLDVPEELQLRTLRDVLIPEFVGLEHQSAP